MAVEGQEGREGGGRKRKAGRGTWGKCIIGSADSFIPTSAAHTRTHAAAYNLGVCINRSPLQRLACNS